MKKTLRSNRKRKDVDSSKKRKYHIFSTFSAFMCLYFPFKPILQPRSVPQTTAACFWLHAVIPTVSVTVLHISFFLTFFRVVNFFSVEIVGILC